MPIFYRLQIPANKKNDRYTQGIAVNSAIVGTKHAVGETRGLLIVLKGGGWGSGPSFEEPYYGPLVPGEPRKITIKVPDEETPITVDVVLAHHTGDISVDAVLEKHKYDYKEIRVYSLDEVEIYDKH